MNRNLMTRWRQRASAATVAWSGICAVVVAMVMAVVVPGSTAVAASQWQYTGSMAVQHGGPALTTLADGRVLTTGGPDGVGGITSATDIYDPTTGQWTSAGQLNSPRMAFHSIATLDDGRVLIAGGHDQFVNDYDSAELFDPATGQWSYTGTLNIARRYPIAAKLLDGRVLVATGARGAPDGGRFLSSAEIYDPATGQWTMTSPAPTSRESATGLRMNDGRVMVVGGYGCCDFFTPATDLYDPTTGTWSSGGNRPHGGFAFALTNMQDGRVLLAGGTVGNSGVTANAAVFDPATNQWNVIASMNYARNGADAILLPDGKVLVAGGTDNVNGVLPGEVYDPATNTWTIDASLNEQRIGGRMVTLSNGTVLMAGGHGTTASELYGAPQVQTVDIDVKPGSTSPAPINLKSKGKVPVAVLSSASFDAATIDASSVRFGATGTEAAATQSALEDVNADGRLDLVLHFAVQDCGLVPATTVVVLTGQITGGQAVSGSDTVTVRW